MAQEITLQFIKDIVIIHSIQVERQREKRIKTELVNYIEECWDVPIKQAIFDFITECANGVYFDSWGDQNNPKDLSFGEDDFYAFQIKYNLTIK